MTAAAAPVLLQLSGVTHGFVPDWRGRRRLALEDVSLEVGSGQIVAVIGPNGSGKSTLLKIAAGLLTPSRRGAGQRIRPGTRIGYLPENPMLPSMSALALLRAYARVQGMERTAAEREARRALERVGLDEVSAGLPAAMSRGQRQRLVLAQALLGAPDILLLDEPAAGLDPHGMARLESILREERARGAGVIVTTHFLPRLEAQCDHCVLLVGGRVRFQGDAADLAARGGAEAIYLAEVPA